MWRLSKINGKIFQCQNQNTLKTIHTEDILNSHFGFSFYHCKNILNIRMHSISMIFFLKNILAGFIFDTFDKKKTVVGKVFMFNIHFQLCFNNFLKLTLRVVGYYFKRLTIWVNVIYLYLFSLSVTKIFKEVVCFKTNWLR